MLSPKPGYIADVAKQCFRVLSPDGAGGVLGGHATARVLLPRGVPSRALGREDRPVHRRVRRVARRPPVVRWRHRRRRRRDEPDAADPAPAVSLPSEGENLFPVDLQLTRTR